MGYHGYPFSDFPMCSLFAINLKRALQMEIFLSHTYHDFYGGHKSPLYNLYHPFLTSPPFLRIKNQLPLFTKSPLLQAIFLKSPL